MNVTGVDTGPKSRDTTGTISAGTSKEFENDDGWDGETVRIVWESENGENSAALRHTVGYSHVTDFDTPECGKASRRRSQQYQSTAPTE